LRGPEKLDTSPAREIRPGKEAETGNNCSPTDSEQADASNARPASRARLVVIALTLALAACGGAKAASVGSCGTPDGRNGVPQSGESCVGLAGRPYEFQVDHAVVAQDYSKRDAYGDALTQATWTAGPNEVSATVTFYVDGQQVSAWPSNPVRVNTVPGTANTAGVWLPASTLKTYTATVVPPTSSRVGP
jgi:hypothetical protein